MLAVKLVFLRIFVANIFFSPSKMIFFFDCKTLLPTEKGGNGISGGGGGGGGGGTKQFHHKEKASSGRRGSRELKGGNPVASER